MKCNHKKETGCHDWAFKRKAFINGKYCNVYYCLECREVKYIKQ